MIKLENNIIKYALDHQSLVTVADARGDIINVSHEFCKLVGYTKEELLGKNHRIFKSGQHSSEFYREMWWLLSTGQTWKGEVCNKTKDGSEIWTYTTIIPILGNDRRVQSYIAIRANINNKKKYEEELRSEEKISSNNQSTKAHVLSIMSNEIRIPVAGILNTAQAIFKTSDEPLVLEQTESIIESADLLLTIIDGVLNLTEQNDITSPTVMYSITPVITPKTQIFETEKKFHSIAMVVENDLQIRSFITKILLKEGYDVIEAENGDIALNKLCIEKCKEKKNKRPDIILMGCDIRSPVGFAAITKIVELQSSSKKAQIPILLMIGFSDEKLIKYAMDAGATDFISKPVYYPVLLHRMKYLIEAYRAQDHIYHLAYHDALTGLPNRLLFNDRLHQAIANCERSGCSIATMFIDLDNFKNVNDTLGHAVGDLLLKSVTFRINSVIREADTLSRMGGDEFLILVQNLQDENYAIKTASLMAQKIIDSLSDPFIINNEEIFIGASIGISFYPSDSDNATSLLKFADSAMYVAKDSGKNKFCLHSDEMNTEVIERLYLEKGLRSALEKDEFSLFYQPQINISSNKITGVEALLRWNHPELGLVSPLKFISIAEDTGLINKIGEWVLITATKQCKEWHDLGHKITISVNLSPKQFISGVLVNTIKKTLRDSMLPPDYLDLEITESVTLKDAPIILEIFKEIKFLGVKVSLDDFGTGYSSLSYLKKFPIDTLKIDKSFINEIVSNHSDASIVQTIIAMSEILKMKTVAEGVETLEQFNLLKTWHCKTAQGYFISKPVPAEDVIKLF